MWIQYCSSEALAPERASLEKSLGVPSGHSQLSDASAPALTAQMVESMDLEHRQTEKSVGTLNAQHTAWQQ
jgi:hypothetical protein